MAETADDNQTQPIETQTEDDTHLDERSVDVAEPTEEDEELKKEEEEEEEAETNIDEPSTTSQTTRKKRKSKSQNDRTTDEEEDLFEHYENLCTEKGQNLRRKN